MTLAVGRRDVTRAEGLSSRGIRLQHGAISTSCPSSDPSPHCAAPWAILTAYVDANRTPLRSDQMNDPAALASPRLNGLTVQCGAFMVA